MYPTTIGTAILAGFGTIGFGAIQPLLEVKAASPETSQPYVSPVIPRVDPSTITVNSSHTPPTMTWLFSATLDIGPAQRPIVEAAGVREAQALTGRIEGPALNATVSAGLATPMVINNGTVATVQNAIFGMTDDNYTFYATQTGVGGAKAQNSVLSLEIGGKYAYLSDRFIIAHIARNDITRTVVLDAYDVV